MRMAFWTGNRNQRCPNGSPLQEGRLPHRIISLFNFSLLSSIKKTLLSIYTCVYTDAFFFFFQKKETYCTGLMAANINKTWKQIFRRLGCRIRDLPIISLPTTHNITCLILRRLELSLGFGWLVWFSHHTHTPFTGPKLSYISFIFKWSNLIFIICYIL